MSDDRTYPARPMLAASVAVVRNGRVLLAARGRPPLADIWSLPGGLVEPGETLAEAALRELAEETGVVAAIVAPVRPIEFVERDAAGRVRHHFVIHPHVAHWVSGEGVESAEAPALAWVRRDEIRGYRTTPNLVPVLERAFDLTAGGGERY